jgi:hypothetical protein
MYAKEGGGGRGQQCGKEVTPGCFEEHGLNFLINATSINVCWGERSGYVAVGCEQAGRIMREPLLVYVFIVDAGMPVMRMALFLVASSNIIFLIITV